MVASTTLTVPWALLATNSRLPSGDMTRSRGSAPVSRKPSPFTELSRFADQASGSALLILMTQIPPLLASATYANVSSGSTATPHGSGRRKVDSVGRVILATTVSLSVRITETLASSGLTTHRRAFEFDRVMGLE